MPVQSLRGRWSNSVLLAILALLCASAIIVYLQHRDLTTLNRQSALILEQISAQAAEAVATDIRRTFEAPLFETLSAVNLPLLRAGRFDLVAREFAEGLATFPQLDRFFLWHEQTAAAAPGEALFFGGQAADGNGATKVVSIAGLGASGSTTADPAPVGLGRFYRDPSFGRLVMEIVDEQAESQRIYGAARRQLDSSTYDFFIRIFWIDANHDRFFAVMGYVVDHETVRGELFPTLYRTRLAALLEPTGGGPELDLRIVDEQGQVAFGPPGPPPGSAGRARFALRFFPSDEIRSRMAGDVQTPIWSAVVTPKAGSLAAIAPSGAPGYWLSGASILFMILALALALQGRRRASQLSRMQTEFVAHVSHQLKTPLSLLSAVSETLDLERVRSPEKMAEYVTTIRTETHRLSLLVERILEFSLVRDPQRTYEMEAVDLDVFVRETVEAFDRTLPRPLVRIESQSRSLIIPADPVALEQVLVNLLDNAVKYSSGDKDVTVTVGCMGADAFIEVRDRGIGIPPEERGKVFERFFRGSGASLHRQGFGLGLAIVREVVVAHHGRVTVESTRGLGTTIRVRLPVMVRREVAAQQAATAIRAARAGRLR